MIDIINRKFRDYKIHKNYGKIYNPIYNLSCEFDKRREPEIFNNEGQRYNLFFLRDFHTAHDPYFPYSKYFLFDRFNIGLDTHFYTHDTMLEQVGKPQKKYGILYETPAIVPKDYDIFDKNPSLNKDFDKIFTYSQKILDKVSNSFFVPFQAAPWYGLNNGTIDSELYLKKNKNISMLSSKKNMCQLHKFRLDLANKCKNYNLADTYGTFDGGSVVEIEVPLTEYRYSIVIENEIEPLYFSERLTNCFMSMTIPIYCGATEIDKFFNKDGIITIEPKDYDSIENILKKCNEEEYNNRINAVIDNFNRVQNYKNVWDSMYLKYLKEN